MKKYMIAIAFGALFGLSAQASPPASSAKPVLASVTKDSAVTAVRGGYGYYGGYSPTYRGWRPPGYRGWLPYYGAAAWVWRNSRSGTYQGWRPHGYQGWLPYYGAAAWYHRHRAR